jgi:GT2 family glycosyltransferase
MPLQPEEVPTISIIIVSYNTRKMTLDCLRALYTDLGDMAAEVFLVDNASSDGSVEAVVDAFPQVEVIANRENIGFGAANNQALARARGEFVLLLNSDAFLAPGALSALRAVLRREPEVAAVGPRLLNGDGSLQVSCYRFPSPARVWYENTWLSAAFSEHPDIGDYRRWQHDSERDVDWVIGACLLVRRSVYEQIGGFDEAFHMYAEETDWQKRMRDHGWAIRFTPAAQATHVGGASGAAEKARINRHVFESLDYYEYKHHGGTGLIALRLGMVIGCFLRAVLWSLVLASMPKRRRTARAKVSLQSWLCLRQLTCWRLSGKQAGHI